MAPSQWLQFAMMCDVRFYFFELQDSFRDLAASQAPAAKKARVEPELPDQTELPESEATKHWIYHTEPYMHFQWLHFPDELVHIAESLAAANPPKTVWLPTSMFLDQNLKHPVFEHIRENRQKAWNVLEGENCLNTANRTCILQLGDQKLLKRGIRMFVHIRWFLVSDAALWLEPGGFVGAG